MAKEFKDWDHRFTKQQIFECRQKWLHRGSSASDIASCVAWTLGESVWSNAEIRENVYFAQGHESAEEWQLFRVSMKGLTTQEKLYMLYNRWSEYVDGSSISQFLNRDAQVAAVRCERCRIENYIGALVRGGQLKLDRTINR